MCLFIEVLEDTAHELSEKRADLLVERLLSEVADQRRDLRVNAVFFRNDLDAALHSLTHSVNAVICRAQRVHIRVEP